MLHGIGEMDFINLRIAAQLDNEGGNNLSVHGECNS